MVEDLGGRSPWLIPEKPRMGLERKKPGGVWNGRTLEWVGTQKPWRGLERKKTRMGLQRKNPGGVLNGRTQDGFSTLKAELWACREGRGGG